MKDDPQEMKNIIDGNKGLIADLRGKLLAEMKKIEDPALADVEAVKF